MNWKAFRRTLAVHCHGFLCLLGIHAASRSIELPEGTHKMHVSKIDLGGYYCPICGYYTPMEIQNEPKETKTEEARGSLGSGCT